MEDLQKLMNEVAQWSDKTFSDGVFRGSRALPIARHLSREVDELSDAIKQGLPLHPTEKMGIKEFEDIKEELADCMMLLLDCSCHLGVNADELVTASFNKLEVNKNRVWGKPDSEGVVEHIEKNHLMSENPMTISLSKLSVNRDLALKNILYSSLLVENNLSNEILEKFQDKIKEIEYKLGSDLFSTVPIYMEELGSVHLLKLLKVYLTSRGYIVRVNIVDGVLTHIVVRLY